MGDFTRVKSPMKIHGRFYSCKKTPDYKMTHQLFTLFWIISNILTFHFYTFSVIYTFYFYIAFEELTFYQKCSIKCVLYSLFYILRGCVRCAKDKDDKSSKIWFWKFLSLFGFWEFYMNLSVNASPALVILKSCIKWFECSEKRMTAHYGHGQTYKF